MISLLSFTTRLLYDIRVIARTVPLLYISIFNDEVATKDPFLLSLIAFHIILTSTILLLRRNDTMLIAVATLLIGGAFLLLPLNNLAIKNWTLFARRNYFDTYGLFAFAVWSVPLIINAFIAIVLICLNIVRTSSDALMPTESSEDTEEPAEEQATERIEQQLEEQRSPVRKSKRVGF